MRFRKKGDVEWLALSQILRDSWDEDEIGEQRQKLIEGLKGIEIGLKHIGPEQAELWGLEAHRLRLEDLARVFALQNKFTEKQMPALYAVDKNGNLRAGTQAGRSDQVKMARDVLTDSVAGVRGEHPLLESIKSEAPEAIAAEIVRWGVGVEVMEAAIATQSLTVEEIFTEGAGDVEKERSPGTLPG